MMHPVQKEAVEAYIASPSDAVKKKRAIDAIVAHDPRCRDRKWTQMKAYKAIKSEEAFVALLLRTYLFNAKNNAKNKRKREEWERAAHGSVPSAADVREHVNAAINKIDKMLAAELPCLCTERSPNPLEGRWSWCPKRHWPI